jgi:hypothetical protein
VQDGNLSEKVVWGLLRPYAEAVGLAGIAPHDLKCSCAKVCRAAGGELEPLHACADEIARYLSSRNLASEAPRAPAAVSGYPVPRMTKLFDLSGKVALVHYFL